MRGLIAQASAIAKLAAMKTSAWLSALVLSSNLIAQSAQPAPPPEARQFDFWVGEWEVFNPAGKQAGESLVEPIAGGWGLLENWTGAGGYTGKSLNTWLPHLKQWQQFWVGAGGALELRGGLNEQGEMVLAGRSTDTNGRETRERITWTPGADGTVRQHWQQSSDGGATWTSVFDGLYRRRAK
jgi:hypothetical protein